MNKFLKVIMIILLLIFYFISLVCVGFSFFMLFSSSCFENFVVSLLFFGFSLSFNAFCFFKLYELFKFDKLEDYK